MKKNRENPVGFLKNSVVSGVQRRFRLGLSDGETREGKCRSRG
jgi:hypothetical protein